MSKKKDTFIFRKSWADALKKRSAEVQLEVYNAIVSYAVEGIVPQMSEIAEVVFDFIRIEIDENNAKYEETVKKRREAGKRGMESRYGKSEESEPVEQPVFEEDDNKSNNPNKTEQDVTNVTNDNKTNKCYQMVTNVTDNDSDSDSVSVNNDDIKKETISGEIVKKEGELLSLPLVVDAEVVEQGNCDDFDLIDESIVAPVSKSCRVDYARVVNLYHKVCVEEVMAKNDEPLSSIQKLTEDRKSKVRSRLKEMEYDYGKLEEVFRAIVDSDFLMGKNGKGWAADFDWIFQNKSNWLKILEGKYNNRGARQDSAKSQLATNVGFMQRAGVKKEDIIF